MRIVLKEKIKCMTGKLKCEGEMKDYRKKSIKADEEN